jgi:hypothetical protein
MISRTTWPPTSVSRKSRPLYRLGQAFVVEAHLVKYRGVQIMHMDRILDDAVA